MNIEKRLDGLTHSVELLAGMQIENEKRMARLAEKMGKLVDRSIWPLLQLE